MATNKDWFQMITESDLSSLEKTIASRLFSRSTSDGDCRVSDRDVANATKFLPQTVRLTTRELAKMGWLDRGDDAGADDLPPQYQLTIPHEH